MVESGFETARKVVIFEAKHCRVFSFSPPTIIDEERGRLTRKIETEMVGAGSCTKAAGLQTGPDFWSSAALAENIRALADSNTGIWPGGHVWSD